MACSCKNKNKNTTSIKAYKQKTLSSVIVNYDKPSKTKEQLRLELLERMRKIAKP